MSLPEAYPNSLLKTLSLSQSSKVYLKHNTSQKYVKYSKQRGSRSIEQCERNIRRKREQRYVVYYTSTLIEYIRLELLDTNVKKNYIY